MKIDLKCMECFIKQALKAVSVATDDPETKMQALKAASSHLAGIDVSKTPAEVATGILKSVIEITSVKDAFYDLKKESNEKVAQLIPKLKNIIDGSEDAFDTAVRISLCGNIIDHGILEDFDVAELIDREVSQNQDADKIKDLKTIVMNSRNMSFIADNAGEIGLDALMLEEFTKLNPDLKINLFVRSIPLINDATIDDAEFFGLQKKYDIIQYPDSVGFLMDGMPDHVAGVINGADIIISKGQANYETLSRIDDGRIIFMLRTKCEVVAMDIGIPEGRPVILIKDWVSA